MKPDIAHLPEPQKSELQRIAGIIREMCPDIETIILFGSYARGRWMEEADLAPDRKSGHPSDYDILAVTREKETVDDLDLWERISERCAGVAPSATPRIIVHEIKFLKERLKEIHYFFSDIVKEGCLLYDSGRYELNVTRELTAKEKHRLAGKHFEHLLERVLRFYRHFELDVEENDSKGAAFHLHQSAEWAYKAFLLVFTNYCPYDHYLEHLDRQVTEILPSTSDVFPRDSEADKERFKLFDYAYIGARYDYNFHISMEDLAYLSGRVQCLLELTEKLCKARIKGLAAESEGEG